MADSALPRADGRTRGWELTDSIDKLLTSIRADHGKSEGRPWGGALVSSTTFPTRGANGFSQPGPGLHAVVWGVVIAGGVVTVSLALFFGLPSWRGHLLMANMLALSIALVFVLIIAMNRPFVGESGVTPEPFQRAMARMAGVDEP